MPAVTRQRGIIAPDTNAAEATAAEELEVIHVSLLADAAAFFVRPINIDTVPSRLQELCCTLSHQDEDYSHVRGQESVQLALVIAAADEGTPSVARLLAC